MNNIVVIPIYKSVPSWNEIISFSQCIKILNNHPICIITFKELDFSYYTNLLVKARVNYTFQYFEKSYFESIEAYNKLLMLKGFYERFKLYDYILIHQLDVYVFRDDLDFWSKKGYDYIGALWFEKHGFYEKGNQLWIAGNGGFSLRKIDAFLNTFNYKKPLLNLAQLEQLHPVHKGLLNIVRRKFTIYTKRIFGVKNNMAYMMENWERNEDQFWTNCFNKTHPNLSIPTIGEALDFGFEKSPGYLFELNGKRLPFGCHAWEKYDYDSFWKNYIKEE